MQKIYLKEINSTNTYAKENIEKFADKTIIYTDRQTAGRGRFTRTWIDLGCRNLYMTIILHPGEKFLETYSNLTQYLSLKTCQTLEEYGVSPQIRWPNDNLVNNKKISGILSEAVFRSNTLKGIALGIGVNLNAKIEDVKAIPDRIATSLNLETGFSVNKIDFQNKIIKEFFLNYNNLIENGFDTIKNDYQKRIDFIGKKIVVTQRDNAPKEEYIAQDIDNLGNLVVKDKNGIIKTLFSGDLIL